MGLPVRYIPADERVSLMLAEQLRRRAAYTPEEPALAVYGGGRLTWRQWDERATLVALALAERGVSRGRVALVFDNRWWLDLAVAYLGVLRAGAVAIPVGPRFPVLDLVRILEDCEPVLTVCPRELTPPDASSTAVTVAELEPRSGPPSGRQSGHFAAQNGEAPAEVLYPEGAMRPAVGRPFTHAEILDAVPLLPAGASGTFVHAFPAGTRAAQEALRLPLLHEGVMSLAVPGFAPRQIAAAVTAERAVACGLTPALAAALAEENPDAWGAVPHVVLSRPPASGAVTAALGRSVKPPLLVTHGAAMATRSAPKMEEVAPLAAAQDGMVWHEQFTPGSFSLAPLVRRYRGPLDVAALESALSEIQRRHPALRTTFTIERGQGVQVFRRHRPMALAVADLSDRPSSEQLEALAALVDRARRRPFDLVTGPLFAPTLVRLGADDHVLVIRTHHAVYDDWSVGVFRRELSALYSAFAAGQPSPLAEPAAHLPDVLQAQEEARRGTTGDADRRFWREELDGAPLSVQLPIHDPERPPGSPHRAPPPMTLELPPDVSSGLRQLARSQRATPFVLLLAAFGALVRDETGQEDLLVSTLAANRPSTELEGLIGCFGKKILVRLRLDGDPTFAELVTRTRRAVMAAVAHQAPAYEAVVQDGLGPAAAVHGLAPQVALKFQAAIVPSEKLALRGLSVGPIEIPMASGPPAHFLAGEEAGADGARQPPPWGAGLYLNCFLGLSVVDTDGGGLHLVTEGVFHPPAVRRLLDRLGTLLSGVVARPGHRVSDLVAIAVHEPPGGQESQPATDLRGFRVDLHRMEAGLSGCPGVQRVTVAADNAADTRLIARVVPEDASSPPALTDLRRWLWRQLPGYAWPAGMQGTENSGHDAADPAAVGGRSEWSQEHSSLVWAWAEATAADALDPRANYWQSFAMIEVLAEATAAGAPIPARHVLRNRTLETLATDLAASGWTGDGAG